MKPPQIPMGPHEAWQIDATLLDVAVMTTTGQRVRPWLIVVMNGAGAVIMFRLTLAAPDSALLHSMCTELVDVEQRSTRDQPITRVVNSVGMLLPTRLMGSMERVVAHINRVLTVVARGRPQTGWDLERLSDRITQTLKEIYRMDDLN